MTFRHRVYTIYKKELVDILRDRRTLLAMIVVPIVLYPLLMLGSIQAVSTQADKLEKEDFVVGFIREADGALLADLIRLDESYLSRRKAQLGEDSPEAADLPEPLSEIRFRRPVYEGREALKAAVQQRGIQVGVIFEFGAYRQGIEETNPITIARDFEEVRSAHAARRIEEMLSRVRDTIVGKRLEERNLPADFVNPFKVKFVELSVPTSILGQILPLILVLMTITGAIYPAIDLTAGERERGTLETLMVCPVSVLELIFGKFLVVTTVAIMGATLNLASVSATVYFGGFSKVIAAQESGVPLGKMAFILVTLIPFAVLMSAIMIAVCSYARTFKEAQNYVTPVILAVLIPGGIAALPTSRLEGFMLVVPVGNMVLFARDMLLGAEVPWVKTAAVLLSTTLYAASAVAIAANLFGKESVVFADAGSVKSLFTRSLIRPASKPSVSMSLLVVALLFPAWFFVQGFLSPGEGESAIRLLDWTGILMPVLFVLLPFALLTYWRIDIANTLALRRPGGRYVLAAVLLGLSAWVLAHEVNVLQAQYILVPEDVLKSATILEEALQELKPIDIILLLAIVPAICEELLFRGFLLSGLRGAARKWTAILVTALVFGTFHFFFFKLPVTVGLGVVLGLLCWQSRSILPGMIVHLLHNGVGAMTVISPTWMTRLGIRQDIGLEHFPVRVIAVGAIVFAAGFVLTAVRSPRS